MRLEANPEGAAPGETGASCSSEKAETSEVKASRLTPGAGSPSHVWACRQLHRTPPHFRPFVIDAYDF